MSILYYESSSSDPWRNLSTEEVLASKIGEGDVLLYLWQNERTVVIGRNQNALRECRADLLEREGGYLARRSTGGGAVYHDMGNLCFTFAADPGCYDLGRQMKVVQEACGRLGVKTILSGRNDIITEEGYKFSGNAFSKTGSCYLQHGTLMVDVDREMLQRYLTPSKLKLQAKGIASVRSRVCNLKTLAPQITIVSLKQALREAFCEEYGPFRVIGQKELDEDEIRRIYETKYSSWEWRYGKTPKFVLEKENLFSWGELQLQMEFGGMRITGVKAFSDCLDETFPTVLEKLLPGTVLSLEGIGERISDLQGGAGDNIPEEQAGMAVQVLEWLKEMFE